MSTCTVRGGDGVPCSMFGMSVSPGSFRLLVSVLIYTADSSIEGFFLFYLPTR